MPILKASKKALRVSRRKAVINARVRNLYKIILKKAKKNPSVENLKKAYSVLDKAAKINVIHKNKAARLKSRLAKLAAKKVPVTPKPTKKKTRKPKSTKSSKK